MLHTRRQNDNEDFFEKKHKTTAIYCCIFIIIISLSPPPPRTHSLYSRIMKTQRQRNYLPNRLIVVIIIIISNAGCFLPVLASPWLPPLPHQYSSRVTSVTSIRHGNVAQGKMISTTNTRRLVHGSSSSSLFGTLCGRVFPPRRTQRQLQSRNDEPLSDETTYSTTTKHHRKKIQYPYSKLPMAFFSSGTGPVLIPSFSIIPTIASWFRGPSSSSSNIPGLFLSVSVVSGLGILLINHTSERVRRSIYFWIHAGPLIAHYKFTQWWLDISNAPLEKRDLVYNTLHNKYCTPCMELVLQLKGLYVKIGQVVSSRPDFVPYQYINLFSSLHDSIPQWPIEEVHTILKETYQSELGLDYKDIFETIDPIALGSASIAQVHRAILKKTTNNDNDDIDMEETSSSSYSVGTTTSSTEEVAIKVMHPDAQERFEHDLQVFRWVARIALPGWHNILEEFSRQVMTEFDFIQEATNLEVVRTNLEQNPKFRQRVCIPQPHRKISTRTILVMDMLHGQPLSVAIQNRLANVFDGDMEVAQTIIERKRRELIVGKENAQLLQDSHTGRVSQHPLDGLPWKTRLKLLALYRNTRKWLDLIVDIHGDQIFRSGVFNGDSHVGNVLVLDDGRLGLIDYGQTKFLTDNERLGIAKVVVALNEKGAGITTSSSSSSSSSSIIAETAQAMRELGFMTKFNDEKTLTSYAGLFFDSDVEGKRRGFATPQLFFAALNEADPLLNVPDAAVFVARASFILRGMGTLLEQQIRTSHRWSSYATRALEEART